MSTPLFRFAIACENAMILAIEEGADFTCIGFHDGKIIVPAYGFIY